MPQETTIRILLIADTRLSNQTVESAIEFLEESWENTNLSTTTPTSIQIINGGLAIPAGNEIFSGGTVAQISKLRQLVETPIAPTMITLRDFHGADVVLGLSFDIDTDCGSTPQDNWIGIFTNFDPNVDGLDLREANDDYIGVAQLTGPVSCQHYLAAHEFGHVLGGGHYEAVLGIFSQGLLSNSRAHRILVPGFTVVSAIGAGPSTFDCMSSIVTKCVHGNRYSDLPFGTPNHRNADAFNMTARSVANYRTGGEDPVRPPAQPATCSDGIDNDDDGLADSVDPQCAICSEELCPSTPPIPPPTCDATVAPENIIGWVLQVCVPGTSSTEYQIVWSHDCPSQVGQYQIWAAQPTTDPFTFRWSSVPPYTRAVVEGTPARVKIRSCGVGGCSGLSTGSFLAVDQC